MSEEKSRRVWWYSLAGTLIIGGVVGVPLMRGEGLVGGSYVDATADALARQDYASICRLLDRDDAAVVSRVAAEMYDLDSYPDSRELAVALGNNLNRFETREGAMECAVVLHRMGKDGVDLSPVLASLDQALEHPDQEVRLAVASAVCTMRDASILPSLQKILTWQNEIYLPARLTEALAGIDSPDVYPLLYQCLERGSLQQGAKIALEDRLGIRIEMPAEPTEQEIRAAIQACERARKER